MSIYDGKGISVSTNFDFSSDKPLDSRQVCDTKKQLDKLIEDNAVYPNLFVYCLEDNQYYRYDLTTNSFLLSTKEEQEKFDEVNAKLDSETQARKEAIKQEQTTREQAVNELKETISNVDKKIILAYEEI